MQLITTLLSLVPFLSTILAQDTSASYLLRSDLKPNQTQKEAYAGLYLSSYHTGAGLNDAVFYSKNASDGISGSLNGTIQSFDLGTAFPWSLIMAQSTAFYAGWEPVRIDAGQGSSGSRGDGDGFFINGTGLQWSSSETAETDSFGGWMVCDWWHGVPQLFFRNKYYNTPTPGSCADVFLCPQYV